MTENSQLTRVQRLEEKRAEMISSHEESRVKRSTRASERVQKARAFFAEGKNLFNNGLQAARERGSAALSKTKELGTDALQKARDFGETAKDRTQQFARTAGRLAVDTGAAAKEKAQEVGQRQGNLLLRLERLL